MEGCACVIEVRCNSVRGTGRHAHYRVTSRSTLARQQATYLCGRVKRYNYGNCVTTWQTIPTLYASRTQSRGEPPSLGDYTVAGASMGKQRQKLVITSIAYHLQDCNAQFFSFSVGILNRHFPESESLCPRPLTGISPVYHVPGVAGDSGAW